MYFPDTENHFAEKKIKSDFDGCSIQISHRHFNTKANSVLNINIPYPPGHTIGDGGRQNPATATQSSFSKD